jgi:hypothetical protein
MSDYLNEFTYQAYLAKIESLKGTKKPLLNLIKELYSISDFDLLNYKLSDSEFVTHNKLLFKLITRAIAYEASAKGTTKAVIEAVSLAANNFIKKKLVEPSEVFDLYEHYNSNTLSIKITSISDLDYFVSIVEQLPNTIMFYAHVDYFLNGIPVSIDSRVICAYYLNKFYPDSRLASKLPFEPSPKSEQTLSDFKDIYTFYTKLLKD